MQGKSVSLIDVSVRFDRTMAVEPLSLDIVAGEFFSILGPSGCGKTTLLRVIAGFQPPTTGRVLIGRDDVTSIGANRRPTAMIFQSLALFPHMSVAENVAFGLEARGVGRRQRLARADELLALVALAEHAGKRPNQLSGGQRQRVAIARALAVEPAVLLLDEPLSALDLKLRQHMRAELRAIQKRTGVTFLYITHDQGEALAMSDRIAVMSRGRFEQIGAPRELYDAPASPFIAGFLGEQNSFRGRVQSVSGGMALLETPVGLLSGRTRPGVTAGMMADLIVRPEHIKVGGSINGCNTLRGQLKETVLEGATETLLFDVAGMTVTVHQISHRSALDHGSHDLVFDAAHAIVFPAAASDVS
jgi:spermidine/putrescine transport system ATP-binding protein